MENKSIQDVNGEALRFVGLLVNNEQYPIGITFNPEFRWKIESDRAFSQKAFRICVATKKELLSTPDVLDTGFIESSERVYLCPSFPKDAFTRYFWSVSILDGKTNNVFISPCAKFVTGVRNRSQWTSPFGYYMSLAYNRRIFKVKNDVESAYLFFCSNGDRANAFELYLNGRSINDMEVAPGPQEYMSTLLSGYDITEDLLPNRNNILNVETTKIYSVIIKINYADGESEQINLDHDWQAKYNDPHCTLGYYTDCCVQRGKKEIYNAVIRNDSWYSADDKTEYPSAIDDESFVRYWGPIFIRYNGIKTKPISYIRPVSIIRGDKGWIVDFGTIQAGFVKIRLDGAKKPVRIQYGEYADEHAVSEQQFAYQNIPINEYTPRGVEGEIYHPHFMHTSYRYVEIESEDFVPTFDNITGVFISSVTDDKTDFWCDNEQLSYIMRCAKRSFMSNLINIPTDCPGRERRGWSADATAVVEAEATLFNVNNLYERWLRDLHDAQTMSGWCHVEYPESTDVFIDINWPMHIIIVPWALYQQSGDKQILLNNIDCMERYADMLCSISNDHLFADNLFTYGDWVSIAPAERAFLGAVFYAHVTDLMAQAEAKIDNTVKAEMYKVRFHEICEAINHAYLHVSDDAVIYNNGSQSATTLALVFGICPKEYKDRLFNSLVNEIEQTKQITVGFFANTWLYRLLGDNGRNDLALSLLTDTSYTGASMPNMVNRLRNETLNENFVNIKDSLNHSFLGGGPASWICESLVGLRPIEAGYRNFSLSPYCTSQIPNLSFSIMTDYGKIGVEWKKTDDEKICKLNVTVPYDTECKLSLKEKTYCLSGGNHMFFINYFD